MVQYKLFALVLVGVLLMMRSAAAAAQETPVSTPITHLDGEPMPTYFYPYHRVTGNKITGGEGTFPQVQTVDLTTDFVPEWLVGFRDDDSMQYGWVASTEANARRFTFDAANTLVATSASDARALYTLATPAASPALPDLSPWSHPVAVAEGFVYVDDSGQLVYHAAGQLQDSLDLNLAPDVRPVINENGDIAIFTGATADRYVHGIMGDNLEHAALVIVRIEDNQLRQVNRIALPDDTVYEGLYPIWADINGDDVPDLVTTVSNGRVGSQIRVYVRQDDTTFVEVDGTAIGQPGRWQHQLAWAAFGVDGTSELVDVLTPHIGGTVRFYRYNADANRLAIVAQVSGYTSHIIGSRNLDMAVAGDFNGDGLPEIVMPSQRRDTVAGIQRTADGARVIWELPVDGTIISNLAAIQTPSGLAFAAGRTDGTVRVWVSQE